ncbi:uncharacterized protein LOC119563258 isoform X1 [Drosophila subpulchrella]|uniref:uncharacterized protein LOC119563258 isoform X1 n=1 Tax=Drosophila subpulchrella TaxID=1486046 RepID=UPI0018A1B06D|nr:uncharacterized protein LOC119563258 isoform X1 [Drosophila subpulchrella]
MQKRLKSAAELKRIQALKALFKKVVRMVSFNDPWRESDYGPRISTNLPRNVSNRVRTKRKSGFLTAADKSLIRTPHAIRTIPERMKLCKMFAKFRCLVRFTPKIRARLVPVVRFMPLDAGRKIIRQSDTPITVFFILTGEVHMYRDEVGQEGDKVIQGILGPGDMMGDVELLEGIKRTHTFKTASYCELLVLFDYDFAPILGPYMTKIWDEKKRALKALDYFDFLDNDQIVEACRFGKLKQFDPLETIFCDDIGSMTNVHFVLSGECLILQCLNMKVSLKKGKKFLELMPTSAGEVSQMFRKGVRSTFSTQTKLNSVAVSKVDLDLVESSSSSSKENGPFNTHSRTMRKMRLQDIAKSCGLIKSMHTPKPRYTWRRSTHQKSIISASSDAANDFIDEDMYEDFWEMYEDEDEIESSSSTSDNLDQVLTQAFRTAPAFDSFVGSASDEREVFSSSFSSFSSSSEESSAPAFESHFIDVGTITFGGIFGLGEKMEHRVVMARSTVQCLILPRFFLLEKKQNPGNIWERRLLYMECMIPSREALFAHYLKSCEWKKFKNDFIRETLKPSDNDCTHVDDIPIICKIVESSEDVN